MDKLTASSSVVVARRQPWPEVDELFAAAKPYWSELRWLERDASPEEARAAVRDASALVGSWIGGWPFDKEVFESAPGLRLIQLMSAGYDGLDLAAPAAAGIPVANIGDANASTVAEHAFALMLTLLRRLPEQVALVNGGGWRPAPASREARGRTLGIVGLGRIGAELARRARPFDMDVRYYSRTRRSPESEAELGLRYLPLDELLAVSDVVAVTIALAPETRGLIGATELELMKPGSYVVNVSRGGIVDERALLAALDEGRLAGAGLDVLAEEPPAVDSPLLGRPDVLITPHQAGVSPDLWPRVVGLAWSNIGRALRGEPIRHPVG